MQVAGIVKYVFDNRLGKDGSPNKFPNYKFKIGENEIVLWSAIKPVFLEKGKNLSVICQASKKNGSLFVQTKEDKTPMIQELPSGEPKPDTSFNPDELESQLQQVAKDFDADLTIETKKPFSKDEMIFCMSLLKSGIESGKIGVTKEEIDLKIKDYKFLFQMNFHN
jgi:hypothetical protein